MGPERNRPRVGHPLIYVGVVVVLVFLIGTVFGLVILGRWLLPPGAPPATPVVVVATTPPAIPGPTAMAPPEGPTPTATATPCGPPPAGWAPYTVQSGDTLPELAAEFGVSQERVLQANCLTSPELLAGQALYLPSPPTPTPCGPPPAGWVRYTVQPGDTLFRLATQAGVSQERVLQANCLASPELLAGQALYLPSLPTPTPTPCTSSPPLGWTFYTVRPGDTLFSLAVTRGTSTAEVMAANCLSSPEIMAGQGLYLPPLPVPAEPPVSQVLPTEAPVDSLFDERVHELDTLPVPVGGPNDPDFTPCTSQNGDPWISVETEDLDSNDLQHGQRAYYFACDFPDPATLTARMTGPDGAQSLEVLRYLPNLDLQMGEAQGVVAWNATCDLSTGGYTLVIEDLQGGSDELTFELGSTGRERILTIPQAGPAGTTFQVYYCGYDEKAGQEVVVDLYYEKARLPDGGHDFSHAISQTVTINPSGWAQQELPSLPDDPLGVYLLYDRDDTLKGWDMIWLTR